jgi:lipid A ethanolaminephosphotransferase
MSVLPTAVAREHLPAQRKALRWLARIGLAYALFVAIDIHITQGIGDYLSNFLYPEPDQDLGPPLVSKLVFSLAGFALFISRSLAVRLLAITTTFLSFWLFIAYEALNTSGSGFDSWLGFELGDASTLLIEIARPGAVTDVITAFLPVIAASGLYALAYTGLLAAIARWIAPRVGSAWASLAPILSLSAVYLATSSSGAAVNHFPIPAKVPFQFYQASRLPIYRGKRDPVELTSHADRRQKLLIFIVDESIRGDVLGLNGFAFDTTPFLSSLGSRLLNYGVASSMTNASAGTHVLLQTGFRLDEIDQATAVNVYKRPNLFQYARSAGYETVYIDGQLKGARLQNYMRGTDFDFIDRYHQIRSELPEIERWEIDQQIARRIGEIARERSGEPTFIYVVKSGAHFPYTGSYPPTQTQPALLPGHEIDLEAMAADEIGALRLQYYTAARWAVDEFFRTLLPGIDGLSGTVLYTSDHGQALRENGDWATHGNTIATLPMGLVPLWLLPFGDATASVQGLAASNLARNAGRASHFAIFSTLLVLAGYDRDAVHRRYGESLFDELTGRRIFLSGFYPGAPDPIRNVVPEWTGLVASEPSPSSRPAPN